MMVIWLDMARRQYCSERRKMVGEIMKGGEEEVSRDIFTCAEMWVRVPFPVMVILANGGLNYLTFRTLCLRPWWLQRGVTTAIHYRESVSSRRGMPSRKRFNQKIKKKSGRLCFQKSSVCYVINRIVAKA